MNQSQIIRNSRSQFNVSGKLLNLGDNSNLSEQENAVELNMLSTATDALNQEDSTEFANSKVIFTHHQSSEVRKSKDTEHENGQVAHIKQSAVCCTYHYLQTSRTSQIAQRKFLNNMIRLIPPDTQQVMRLKLNYLKFSTARAIHIVEHFAFVMAIPLACHSVSCIHFMHNCSSYKNDISLFNTFDSTNQSYLPALVGITCTESYDKYFKKQAYIIQIEHISQAYTAHLKRFDQTNNNYCKTQRSTDNQEILQREYSSGELQNHFLVIYNSLLQQQQFSYRISSVTHLVTHKSINLISNYNIRYKQQNILINSRQELLMTFSQDLIEDNNNLTFDQQENEKQIISSIILNQIKQDINSRFTSQILESYQISQSKGNPNPYNKNTIPIYNHDSNYKEKIKLFEKYSFNKRINNKIEMNSTLKYQQQPILIYSDKDNIIRMKRLLEEGNNYKKIDQEDKQMNNEYKEEQQQALIMNDNIKYCRIERILTISGVLI